MLKCVHFAVMIFLWDENVGQDSVQDIRDFLVLCLHGAYFVPRGIVFQMNGNCLEKNLICV